MGELGHITLTFTTRGGEVFRGNASVGFWGTKKPAGGTGRLLEGY